MLLSPVVLMALLFGGARPWTWQGLTCLFFVALSFWTFRQGLFPPLPGGRAVRIATFCLMCVPIFQTIPLPTGVQEFLSPTRAAWSRALDAQGVVAGTVLSYEPLASWMTLSWWLFLAAFAGLLFHTLISHKAKTPIWLLHALFMLAAFEAFYGILQVLIPALGVLWDIRPDSGLAYAGYARGTFINRNHFAAFLGLLWPLLLAYLLILGEPRKMEAVLGGRARAQEMAQKKALGVFCLGMIILAMICSQSRGAILAAGFAFTLLCLLAGLRHKRVLLVLGACWAVAMTYGGIIGFDGVAERFDRIDRDASARFEIWDDAWQAALDHPLTGTGLGTYPSVGRAYQNAMAPQMRASHAHNDYLETAVELGLPAAIIFIAALWGLWWHRAILLWRRRDSVDEDHLVLGAASLASLGGFMLHAWVEFNSSIPVNQLAAVMVATLHFAVTNQIRQPGTEKDSNQSLKPICISSFPHVPEGSARHPETFATPPSTNLRH